MSFLAPLAFWFALALPVVVVFYLLKRRRRVLRVPSTVLWQRYLAELQASAPFQKLRKNWLLLLQLLLLALAVFALARPFRPGTDRPRALRVVILDTSASMQSTDVAPNRFEAARRQALALADGLRDGQQMIVLEAGARTVVRQSATSDRNALRRALGAGAVTDGPTRLGEALRMAESLVRDAPDAEVHLFSDGAVADLSEFENRNLPLVFHRVGERGRNAGIVRLEVRPNPEDPAQRAVFTAVANRSDAPLDAELQLLFDGQVVSAQPVAVPAGETLPVVFTAAQPRDGVFTVRLRADDDLAADNEASFVSLLPPPVRVLLVTRGNRFLERALRAAGRVELTVAPAFTGDAAGLDFVVFDDVPPLAWPDVNTLAFRVAPTNWFEVTGRLEGPPIVDWRGNHPLLRFVGFDNVQVAEAVAVKPPSWALSLVDSPQAPLLLAGELGGRRVAWVAFDLLQSTWPLRVSFPLFIANAVEWLNPAVVRGERLQVRAGDPLRIAAPAAGGTVELTLPGGGTRTLTADAGAAELVFGDTARAGLYTVRAGTNSAVYAVHALDAAETATAPRDTLPVGRFGGTQAAAPVKANAELWRWFAAVALAVLLFEWWFYHRRAA
ncbi:MAG: BatA domain-containing protein [Limisphaerales bacterium]